MKLWSGLACGVLAGACLVAAQTAAETNSPQPAAENTQNAPAQSPLRSAEAPSNRPSTNATCPPGAAWFCVTQTLQRLMFNLNGTHRPDAEIAALVPKAIAQMLKDGVMKPENAPAYPINGFEDANRFLNSYPADAPESSSASVTPPAAAGPSTAAPAKSEECPPDRPWLCPVTGPTPPAPNASAGARTADTRPADAQKQHPPTPSAAAPKAPAPASKKSDRPAPAADATAKKTSDDDAAAYVFGPNDVISINVAGERDLTSTYTIMPDGRMSMPIIGSFKATGYTVDELTDIVTGKLRDDAGILEPVVNIQLLRSNSKKYTIAGAVLRPGPQPLIQETTLFDALIAVGFQDFANKKKIILRRTTKNGTKDFTFNYKDALKGKGMDKNVILQDGDYIVVSGD